jgi:hypothetical protein
MLRVLTYNGPPARQVDRAQLRAIADVLSPQQAGAVALIATPSRAQIDALAQALGMRAVYAPQDSPPLAWLTRLPILGGESYDYLPGARPMLRLDVSWNGLRVSLFAVHLRAGWRNADEQARSREMVALLQYLPRVMGEPHLIAGGFSALHPLDGVAQRRMFGVLRRPGAEERAVRLALPHLLDAGYTDCFRAMHRGASREPGYTYPASQPRLRSDYVFASAQLARRLVACDVVTAPPAVSDHFPVLAEFL